MCDGPSFGRDPRRWIIFLLFGVVCRPSIRRQPLVRQPHLRPKTTFRSSRIVIVNLLDFNSNAVWVKVASVRFARRRPSWRRPASGRLPSKRHARRGLASRRLASMRLASQRPASRRPVARIASSLRIFDRPPSFGEGSRRFFPIIFGGFGGLLFGGSPV